MTNQIRKKVLYICIIFKRTTRSYAFDSNSVLSQKNKNKIKSWQFIQSVDVKVKVLSPQSEPVVGGLKKQAASQPSTVPINSTEVYWKENTFY